MRHKDENKPEGIELAEVLLEDTGALTPLERLTLVFKRGEPLVAQFIDQIALLLVARALCANERLPTLDEATRLFGISRNTVMQAYQGLEQHGITTNRVRAGTVFTANAENAARRYLIARDTESLFAHAQALGLKREEVVGVFLATIDRLDSKAKNS